IRSGEAGGRGNRASGDARIGAHEGAPPPQPSSNRALDGPGTEQQRLGELRRRSARATAWIAGLRPGSKAFTYRATTSRQARVGKQRFRGGQSLDHEGRRRRTQVAIRPRTVVQKAGPIPTASGPPPPARKRGAWEPFPPRRAPRVEEGPEADRFPKRGSRRGSKGRNRRDPGG